MVTKEVRESNEAELAYLARRAESALDAGDLAAHIIWATKWHSLAGLLGVTQ